jgi:uncharacterized alpha-E superfamily protein
VLSRVADSFYWLRRYLERAEHSARVLLVYQGLKLDDPTDSAGRRLLSAVGDGPPGFSPPGDPHRSGVAGCIAAARENARQIREQISSEMWEHLNRLYLRVRDSALRSHDGTDAFMRTVIEGTHLFQGVAETTLSHGEGWHYMQLGRYIERATTTASMLEEYFPEPAEAATARIREYAAWVGLLRACAAFEPYCRTYTADITPERLIEFLLLNAESPRSVRFAADRIEESLRAIARILGRSGGPPERFAGRLRASLNFGTVDEIMEGHLARYVASVRKQCDQIHLALFQTYISYPIETAIAR